MAWGCAFPLRRLAPEEPLAPYESAAGSRGVEVESTLRERAMERVRNHAATPEGLVGGRRAASRPPGAGTQSALHRTPTESRGGLAARGGGQGWGAQPPRAPGFLANLFFFGGGVVKTPAARAMTPRSGR